MSARMFKSILRTRSSFSFQISPAPPLQGQGRHALLRYSNQARSHPLAPQTPSAASATINTPQRFSTAVLISLSTLVGALTYTIASSAPGPKTIPIKSPSVAGYAAAMESLESWMPKENISKEKDCLIDHGYSQWSYHEAQALPGCVIYPRSTQDVVKLVKLAALHSIPLVPYSGGTSLEGHFHAFVSVNEPKVEERVPINELPPGLGWSLDFTEMGEIIKINAGDLDIVVQPGVSYDAINATLREQNIPLFFPVDPAPGAMIGGMISTGASGTNAVKYGTMRENVLNVTVVTADGSVITTRSRAKKSSVGPDLTRLFIGAEGTLGIITEATLKLSPLLPTSVAVCAFPSVTAAAAVVRDVIQGGVNVACIELLDEVMIKAINLKNQSMGNTRHWEEKPSLFLKFSGSEATIKGDIEAVRLLTKKNEGSKFEFAKNEVDAEEIWYSRKIALWSALELLPGSKCWTTDVAVPISKIPEIVQFIKDDITKHSIIGPIVSHAGDGNVHALLLFRNDQELEAVKGVVKRMVKEAQRLNGTASGEHGVGIGKLEYMEGELGTGTVDLLRSIKELLDPQNIMNPGKLIPARKV